MNTIGLCYSPTKPRNRTPLPSPLAKGGESSLSSPPLRRGKRRGRGLGRRHRALTALSCVCLLALTTSCNTLSHADAKVEAHRRWNHVRGQIKLQLAEQQYESHLFEDAAQNLKESIALDPTQPTAYALLAKAYLELGKAATAQQVLDAADRAGLASAELAYLKGVILEQRGQVDSAVEAYAEARKLDPRSVDYLVAHVECLVSLERPQEAIRLIDENADQIDDDGTVSAMAAHIAAMLGDTNQACHSYGQALASHNDSQLLAEELGRLLVRAHRYEEALAILSPVPDADSGEQASGVVRRAVATCHLALGNPASAREVLGPYAQSHPEDTIAQLILAKAALACDDVLTALRAVDFVQQREPDQPELWLVRAALNFKRRRLIPAASDLYDVLQNDPEDVDAHCLLAEVMRARDQADAARTHFERALAIDPTCTWATHGLKALTRGGPAPVPLNPKPEQKLTSAPADPSEAVASQDQP